MKAKFIGCDEVQHNWGSHTGDFKLLKIGKYYNVKDIEQHSWHTKIYLKDFEGSFNSCCFVLQGE